MVATLETTTDEFLGGRLKLQQPKEGFRAGLDSVLLAAAAMVDPGAAVLDAGCGSGVAGLCLLSRVAEARLTGVDLDDASIHLCTENSENAGFTSRARFHAGDVFDLPGLVGRDRFDHVISNPPFHNKDEERLSPRTSKAAAHALLHAKPYKEALGLWIAACLATLKTKGRITLINRTEALPAMLTALEGPAGALEITPLWPRTGEPAKRVIVSARKGARAGAVMRPGHVLHAPEGAFTPHIEAVLRDCAPLGD